MRSRPSFGRIAATTLETLAWVGVATALVAPLDSVATPAGLGSLYLIAVLAVAIRRGQIAALAAAVLGVSSLNFFFIKPLHQLTIADSDNVVALGVLLLAALVVGRLAAQRGGRRPRPSCAPNRRRPGSARRRCSRTQPPPSWVGRTTWLPGSRQPRRAGRGELRLGDELRASAERRRDRAAPADRGPASGSTAWTRGLDGVDLNRIATPLARLLDVAAERERPPPAAPRRRRPGRQTRPRQ